VGAITDFQLLQAEADSVAPGLSQTIEKGGKPEMFLEFADDFKPVKPTSYRSYLKDASKRFPEFEKYLDRGQDWYNESGTALWLRGQRKPKPNQLLNCIYCTKKINPTSFLWNYHLENKVQIIYHKKCKAINTEMETETV